MSSQDKLLILQRQLTIAVLALLILALVFIIGWYFADILRILGISLVLAYMVLNTIAFLEKWLKNRLIAVLLVYILLFVAVVFIALLVIPALIVQINQLVETMVNATPELLKHLTTLLAPLEQKFKACQIEVKATDILTNVIVNLPRPDPTLVLSKLTDVAMGTMTWTLYWVSIAVVTFYFLLDGNRIKATLVAVLPKSQQKFFLSVIEDADRSLESFFRGQIILGLAFGLCMLAIFLFFGVKYALLLSIFLATMEVLPVIGPPIGFLPVILSVACCGTNMLGTRLTQVVVLTFIFILLQQFKDNIVAPKYIGNVIGLHPIMIFIAIMIGARLDGLLGIIFALPAACVINVFFSHLHKTWARE